MSRIGKKPIELPQGVNVELKQGVISVQGPKGELSYALPSGVTATRTDGKIEVTRNSDSKSDRSLHGLARSLIANMVSGVSKGYTRTLEITGVGFRAQVKGNKVAITLGYSHPVEYEIPDGIKVAVDEKQTTITLTGIDNHLLGQTAANLRKLRLPDAYKGKGVRYAGQRIKLKAGKTGKK
ncbi:MAG: 50S ribosomal protein L6 [Nitrospirae bacterium]|nr:50S ribosomal protein L6 [Nitrospirota bacterium]